jgi:hypothetical protein
LIKLYRLKKIKYQENDWNDCVVDTVFQKGLGRSRQKTEMPAE